MNLTEEQSKEFQDLTRPILIWLENRHNFGVIISPGYAMLVSPVDSLSIQDSATQ